MSSPEPEYNNTDKYTRVLYYYGRISSAWKQKSVKIFSLSIISAIILSITLAISHNTNNNVFVIRTAGGLGNRMFLLAGQFTYAKHFNKEICLEKSFDDAFNIPIRLCSQKEINLAKKHSCSFYYFSQQVFSNNKCLEISKGYLQDERFFAEEKNTVKKMFKFIKPFSEKLQAYADEIKKKNSVSVHIRRTDYLKYPEIYPTLSLDYYEAGADYIQKHSNSAIHLFVFSDDTDWVKENFTSKHPFTIISKNSAEDDMHLMSLCKHNIIANSTFSWWAAYLNKNKNKIVVAPDHWNNQILWWGDNIILDDWIVLSSNPKMGSK